VFAAACNNSALDVDSLSNAMSIAAPVFKAAGYSINDAALYMGVMANNGIDAGEAANALKTGLARLAAPTDSVVAGLAKIDWSLTNADGTMKDTITIQRELHDKFAQLSEAEQLETASLIFGKNQMAKWLALINTAPADVQQLSGSLSQAAGTTDAMASAMMDGFGGSIEQLKSTVDVLMVSAGRLIAEFLLPIIKRLTGLVTWLNSLDDGTKRLILTIAAIVAAIGPLLIIIGTLLSSIGQIMIWAPAIAGAIGTLTGTVLPALMGAIKALWALMMANPIAVIIGLIALVVAAVIHLWKTNEGFRNAVLRIFLFGGGTTGIPGEKGEGIGTNRLRGADHSHIPRGR
jgi:phage-related protein